MDVKKIGIIAGIFIGSFLVVIVVVYLLYPTLKPEAIKAIEASKPKEKFSVESYNPEDFDAEAITRLRRTVIELQDSLELMKSREARYLANIDSLALQVAELLNRPKPVPVSKKPEPVQTKAEPKETEIDERIREIAKTLLNLDEEELTPIANLMTEDELADLYSTASKSQKEKLLRVLTPEKAASILKKVMS